MAWTAPITFVGNQEFKATHLNVYLRDNMLEMATPTATTESSYFMSDGGNSLAERNIKAKRETSSSSTTSTSFAAPTAGNAGPAVTVTTGTRALVWIGAQMQNSAAGDAAMSWAVSGASTIAAANTWDIQLSGTTAANPCQWGNVHMHEGLTAGSNTFTAQYRTSGATTATFDKRIIIVMPL